MYVFGVEPRVSIREKKVSVDGSKAKNCTRKEKKKSFWTHSCANWLIVYSNFCPDFDLSTWAPIQPYNESWRALISILLHKLELISSALLFSSPIKMYFFFEKKREWNHKSYIFEVETCIIDLSFGFKRLLNASFVAQMSAEETEKHLWNEQKLMTTIGKKITVHSQSFVTKVLARFSIVCSFNYCTFLLRSLASWIVYLYRELRWCKAHLR